MNDFEMRIHRLWEELGIGPDFRRQLRLPLQAEAIDLVRCEDDMFGRTQQMAPQTATAWQEMKRTAAADGIELQLVSAFRSVDYQCTLIRRKLEQGQQIPAILAVNAAPGYSEHHTGRALDLSTPGSEPLSPSFETTPAFGWLCTHAATWGFTLSYPRDNPFGITYEPWHWALRD